MFSQAPLKLIAGEPIIDCSFTSNSCVLAKARYLVLVILIYRPDTHYLVSGHCSLGSTTIFLSFSKIKSTLSGRNSSQHIIGQTPASFSVTAFPVLA